MLIFDDDTISIRSVQHFLYCQHRWGLLNIDDVWAENAFVTKANIIHKHVHNSDTMRLRAGVKTYYAVPVFNNRVEYNIYGVLDCLEVTTNVGGKIFSIVEYKPTKPRNTDYNYDDMMQVYAQKICVDNIFNTDCNTYIYYADTKSRVKLTFNQCNKELSAQLIALLSRMRAYSKSGTIPPISSSNQCSGCSIKNVCMPYSVIKIHKTTKEQMITMVNEVIE